LQPLELSSLLAGSAHQSAGGLQKQHSKLHLTFLMLEVRRAENGVAEVLHGELLKGVAIIMSRHAVVDLCNIETRSLVVK